MDLRRFSVTKSFDTDVEEIYPIRLLGDRSVVFIGEKQGQRKLIQYNLHTNAQMSCVDVLKGSDVSPVELLCRSSLAVSFS